MRSAAKVSFAVLVLLASFLSAHPAHAQTRNYYEAQAYQDAGNLGSAFDKPGPGAVCDAVAQAFGWNEAPFSTSVTQLLPGLWRCQRYFNGAIEPTVFRNIVGQCQLLKKAPLVGFRSFPQWHQDVGLCSCSTSSFFDGAAQWCDRVVQICTGPSCPDPDKFKGEDCDTPKSGCPISNPIGVALGNKVQVEKDISGAFGLERRYDGESFGAGWLRTGRFGRRWTSIFESAIEPSTDPDAYNCYRLDATQQPLCTIDLEGLATATAVKWRRSDGSRVIFRRVGTSYVPPADVADRLERIEDGAGAVQGWKVVVERDERTELFDASGRLLSVESRTGLTHRLSYADGANGILYHPASTVAPSSPLGYSAPGCSVPHPAISGGGTGPSGTLVPAGVLLCATDHFGRELHFQYANPSNGAFDPRYRVRRVIDAAGGQYTYEYDGPSGGCVVSTDGGCNRDNLTRVTYPDNTTRTYHYNEAARFNNGAACPLVASAGAGLGPFPNHLTGVTDENGVRFATWSYDCEGRAVSGEHAGGVERFTVTYPGSSIGSATSTVVTDPLGAARSYSFQTISRSPRNGQITGALGPQYGAAAQSFDGNGNFQSRTDWNGNRTNYTYDPVRNLETSRTEGLTAAGAATAQTRTTTTEWHPSFRLPTRIAEPLRITTNTYDVDGSLCGAKGALCSRSIQSTDDVDGSQGLSATPVGTPRTWTYSYNGIGQILTMDGPRTDVADTTAYAYDTQGNVATITNAAGHVTSITAYNAHGQPLTVVDPNALITTLAYDVRQRLTGRTVGGETTTYDYDNAGQLVRVTLPDSSYLEYTYDPAHRLTAMQDNLGNRIAYTLDAMGNRTLEEVRDPSNNLAQTRSRVYSNLNRLFQELGAQSQTTEYTYDDQGNVLTVKDPLNRVTSNQYDALNRLAQVTDPALGVTQYAHNGLDALTQVIDPRSLVTGYTVDGLGNLTQQASPDTGSTVNTYDAAGNLLTQTDAKSQTTSYAYDILNRVTLITFHGGAKQAYAYDLGANGLGRLSSITETDPGNQVTSQIAYAYDQHGRVTSETRTVAGVANVLAYRYDSFGRMDRLTYPSGRTVDYAFDALGRVSAITTTAGGSPQTVVQSVAYHPFGGVKSYTLGNGQTYARSYDLDGRVSSYTLGAQAFGIGYDAASRIEFISELGNPSNANTYGYDALDRLTNAVTPAVPYAYGYDAVGNRLSRTAGSSSDTYAYSPSSNRIASITPQSGPVRSFVFDANGSTTADGNNTYAYDTRGRMASAVSSLGTTTYQVNALGQRIRKTNVQDDRVFHYDTRGKLIAETDPGGAVKREIFYLGDIPVGVFQ